MMLRGEIPEYVPASFEPSKDMIADELIAPVMAPNGPITTVYGVEYIGTPENNWGAMPTPGKIILRDITKWRDVIKNRTSQTATGKPIITRSLRIGQGKQAACGSWRRLLPYLSQLHGL